MKRAGMNVEYTAIDFGSVLRRRVNKGPPAQGGWNAYVGNLQGMDWLNPLVHTALRGDGAYPGWFVSPRGTVLPGMGMDRVAVHSGRSANGSVLADARRVRRLRFPKVPPRSAQQNVKKDS